MHSVGGRRADGHEQPLGVDGDHPVVDNKLTGPHDRLGRSGEGEPDPAPRCAVARVSVVRTVAGEAHLMARQGETGDLWLGFAVHGQRGPQDEVTARQRLTRPARVGFGKQARRSVRAYVHQQFIGSADLHRLVRGHRHFGAGADDQRVDTACFRPYHDVSGRFPIELGRLGGMFRHVADLVTAVGVVDVAVDDAPPRLGWVVNITRSRPVSIKIEEMLDGQGLRVVHVLEDQGWRFVRTLFHNLERRLIVRFPAFEVAQRLERIARQARQRTDQNRVV